MRYTTVHASTFGLLAALTAPIVAQESSYFVMYSAPPLVVERLDPLLSAGKVSNHMHTIIGANGFAPTMDFAQTQKADCSTLPVKADKSNYWMPSLYFKSPRDGSFTRASETSNTRIYYKFGTGKNGPDLERSEFPKEFRMITGNSKLRKDDGSMGSPGNQLNWMCHDGGAQPRSTGFPKFTNCDYMGLAATIRFPSCWNGKDFNPADPHAHMDFPINKDGLAGCEAPFNVKRFPEIMIEFWVDISQFTGQYGINDNPFVLAPGDDTGFAFHADFINGWEPGVLAKAMKTCRVGNTAQPLDTPACFGSNSLYTDAEKKSCKVKSIVPEDNGTTKPLKALPGCNPIQPAPGPATIQTNCPNVVTSFGEGITPVDAEPALPVKAVTTMATSVAPKATSKSSTSTSVTENANYVTPTTKSSAPVSPAETEASTSTGSTSGDSTSITADDGSTWTSDGCYVDSVNPRTLPTVGWWGKQITNSECAKGCSKMGFSVSGTENGGQCFCGNKLDSKKADSSECNASCAGDSSQKCGGSARLSVFKKTTAKSKKSRAQRHLDRHRQAVS